MGTIGMPYTASGKVKLQFEENGHGYPILFRHGFEFDSRAWDLQVRHLARNYRCTTYMVADCHPVTFLKS
jgi:pimeloyl-ACP methyl ester carboxylesterase